MRVAPDEGPPSASIAIRGPGFESYLQLRKQWPFWEGGSISNVRTGQECRRRSMSTDRQGLRTPTMDASGPMEPLEGTERQNSGPGFHRRGAPADP